MSGRDERKETVKVDEVSERINRLTCLHCGSHTWVQWNNYSSRTIYNSEDNYSRISEVFYTDTTDWKCHDCGWAPNAVQRDELCEMRID